MANSTASFRKAVEAREQAESFMEEAKRLHFAENETESEFYLQLAQIQATLALAHHKEGEASQS